MTVPCYIEYVGWAPEPVWALWRRDKYFVPAGNRTTASECLACAFVIMRRGFGLSLKRQ